MTLHELFSREEEKRLAETRAEIAAEKAAYDALPQAEKDRLLAEAEAHWEVLEQASLESQSEEDDAEEEDEDEAEED